MKNTLLLSCLTASLILSAGSCGRKSKNVEPAPEIAPVPAVTIDTTHLGLVIYFPPTDSIELRCFDRPDPAVDSSIVFCCAAAFTADWETEASHERIQGDHVSGGQLFKRPKMKRNTGAFIATDSTYRFLYHYNADPVYYRTYFEKVTTAFTQEMMIHQMEKVKTTRPDNNFNQFRALCLTNNGRLCVAEATQSMPFGAFIQQLLAAGMYDALYLDMGPGWNYSWYREYAGGEATYIHSNTLACATNWLVFHKK